LEKKFLRRQLKGKKVKICHRRLQLVNNKGGTRGGNLYKETSQAGNEEKGRDRGAIQKKKHLEKKGKNAGESFRTMKEGRRK